MDDKALLRCHVKVDQEQGWRSTCPVSRLTCISRQLFRVILLRRLHLPLPPTGVAFHTILVAITEQLGHGLSCWEEERVGCGECCSGNLP